MDCANIPHWLRLHAWSNKVIAHPVAIYMCDSEWGLLCLWILYKRIISLTHHGCIIHSTEALEGALQNLIKHSNPWWPSSGLFIHLYQNGDVANMGAFTRQRKTGCISWNLKSSIFGAWYLQESQHWDVSNLCCTNWPLLFQSPPCEPFKFKGMQ